MAGVVVGEFVISYSVYRWVCDWRACLSDLSAEHPVLDTTRDIWLGMDQVGWHCPGVSTIGSRDNKTHIYFKYESLISYENDKYLINAIIHIYIKKKF